ncbi:MAG TPA: hypothetical protein DEP66_02715, partial [Acidimicrobiaceae bacterium]|nr:hypothetical protein [Acidimicrobiaceae bacterium]
AGGASGASAGGAADGSAAAGTDGSAAAADGTAAGASGAASGSARAATRVVPGEAGENYLLVGTDSVAGFDADDPVALLRSGNSHLADTIMVLHLRADSTAALLSVPRDLLVTISGTGRVAKINSAYNIDTTPAARATRLIDTIEAELDITLQHFVEVDLDGFRRLVDAVDGVAVHFDAPLRDRTAADSGDPAQGGSGFAVAAGDQVLDGDMALAYVRSRHLLELRPDGTWQRYGVWNDLERNDRQREFLVNAAGQAADKLLGNPLRLRRVLDIAADAVATSDTLNVVSDGLRLAAAFQDFDFDAGVEQYELSVVDVIEPGRWALGLFDERHNERVLDVFRGIGWHDVVESRVSVRVSGQQRWDVAAQLTALGFDARAVGAEPAAPAARTLPQRTSLAYGPDGRLAAALVASHLASDVATVPDAALAPNTVALHLAAGEEPPVVSAAYRQVALPEPAAE